MKKIAIFSLITLFVSLVISGCGSNTRMDPIYVSPYKIVNATTPLEINKQDSDFNISMQLLNGTFGYAGQIIRIVPFSTELGTLVSASSTTNSDGWASFTYHSPSNMSPLIGQSYTLYALYVSDDNTTTEAVQEIVLNFTNTAPDGNRLTNATTPISVNSNDTTQEIAVFVLDKNQMGVSGEKVTSSFLDPKYGTISPATAETDASGKASFTYKSPANATQLYGQSTSVTLSYYGQSVNVVIKFEPSQYLLTNATTPIYVDENATSREISVHIVDGNRVGVADESVTTSIIDSAFGHISPSTVVTDSAGKATFNYVGPSDITNMIGDSTSITIMYGTQTLKVEIKIVAPPEVITPPVVTP